MFSQIATRLNPDRLLIRPIAPQDDAALEKLVIDVLTEFGCVGPGYASEDPEIKSLSTLYRSAESSKMDRGYWVVADGDSQQVYGGGGFARLKGTTEMDGICELQKYYFAHHLRGLGFGRKILELCIREAKQAGYREMYLESTPQMKKALGIYEKFGFHYLPGPMGNTGHHSCSVFMSLDLSKSHRG